MSEQEPLQSPPETSVFDEPKPILVGFLERHTLNEARIVGDELRVMGINRTKDPLQIATRQITMDEMDAAADWAVRASELGKASDLLHFNMKLLLPLRYRMPLAATVFSGIIR